MIKITVLHGEIDRSAEGFQMHNHTKVATLAYPGDDVEGALAHAWRYTNNVEGSWSKGPTVEFNGETVRNGDYHVGTRVLAALPVYNGKTYGHRSSMVGDIFEIEGSDRYAVAPMGFTKLEPGATHTEAM